MIKTAEKFIEKYEPILQKFILDEYKVRIMLETVPLTSEDMKGLDGAIEKWEKRKKEAFPNFIDTRKEDFTTYFPEASKEDKENLKREIEKYLEMEPSLDRAYNLFFSEFSLKFNNRIGLRYRGFDEAHSIMQYASSSGTKLFFQNPQEFAENKYLYKLVFDILNAERINPKQQDIKLDDLEFITDLGKKLGINPGNTPGQLFAHHFLSNFDESILLIHSTIPNYLSEGQETRMKKVTYN